MTVFFNSAKFTIAPEIRYSIGIQHSKFKQISKVVAESEEDPSLDLKSRVSDQHPFFADRVRIQGLEIHADLDPGFYFSTN